MTDPLHVVSLAAGYRSRRNHIEIVHDVSARLRSGEFACLVGVNGSGKSTLLRTMSALQPKLAGRVYFDGVPIEEITQGQLARRLSLVLTDRVYGRHLSGLDVVRLGRHPYTGWSGRLNKPDHQAVDEAIAVTGCGELMGRSVESMSDGERQRVMIARAVAQHPRVMLLDEPTAFLDITHRLRLTALLRDLTHSQGIAVLMSTHDLDLALRTADTVWLVQSNGHLLVGAPEDVALSGILSSEFSSDRLVFDDEFGGFRIKPRAARGVVTVAGGDSVAMLWTLRALSRIGFTPITHEGDSKADVAVGERGWRVDSETVLTSVGDLVSYFERNASHGPSQ